MKNLLDLKFASTRTVDQRKRQTMLASNRTRYETFADKPLALCRLLISGVRTRSRLGTTRWCALNAVPQYRDPSGRPCQRRGRIRKRIHSRRAHPNGATREDADARHY